MVPIKSLYFVSIQKFVWRVFYLQVVIFQPILAIFVQNSQHMPILRRAFILLCQIVKILKMYFYDVIINITGSKRFLESCQVNLIHFLGNSTKLLAFYRFLLE